MPMPLAAARAYRSIYQKRLIDRHGREIPGHLDDSAGPQRPAVVVVHDFFGLTAQIKEVTARLANAGFVAFAADLYRGEVASTREDAAVLAQGIAWNRVAAELGLAIHALADKNAGAPVAIVGFAMGGAAAMVAAAAVDKLAAAVTFYGIPQDVVIDNGQIKIQGHFASRDAKCTRPRVESLDRALGERGIAHEFFAYDADNGFFNPTRTDVHSPAAAELAWDRTLRFLGTTLA